MYGLRSLKSYRKFKDLQIPDSIDLALESGQIMDRQASYVHFSHPLAS